jgi:hypothetical protein
MSESDNWRGENVPEGMVLFHGDDVEAQDIGGIRISDIAPTILHWMGHAIPSDMDGSAITDVFAAESEPGNRAVETRRPLASQGSQSKELDDNVEERLSDIGYLE